MTTWRSMRPLTLLLLCGLCLSACGGGGSSGNAQTPTAPSPPSGSSGSDTSSGSGSTDSQNFQASGLYKNSCGDPRTDTAAQTFPDRLGRFEDEAYWLRSWSWETYLWYDEINYTDPEDITPSAQGVIDYFDTLITPQRTPAGNPKDRFHYTRDTAEYQAASRQGIVYGYGASYELISATPPRELVISLVEANSPAANAGISRGARILEIDGADLINGNDVDTLNAGLFPSQVGEQHSFRILDRGASAPRTVTLSSAQIREDPVPITRVIATDTGDVGYLLFTSHIRTAEQKLVDAVRSLREQNITDLMLDLRYNGGGYLYIANQLAYMIAGSGVAGQTFGSLEFNNKNPNTNSVTGLPVQPTAFLTTTVEATPANSPLPTLNLPRSRVFVLTTSGTCSASEALMNGLRGVGVEVIQIGATTCGKPYGFIPLDNCGTTYFTTQFRGVNARGFGDYPDGFSAANSPETATGVALPGCFAAEDYSPLGNTTDPFVAAALGYRQNLVCPSSAQSGTAPSIGTSHPSRVSAETTQEALVLTEPVLQDMFIAPR